MTVCIRTPRDSFHQIRAVPTTSSLPPQPDTTIAARPSDTSADDSCASSSSARLASTQHVQAIAA